MGSNPNVHSAVVVSLEPVIANKIAERIRKTGKDVEVFSIDECKDTICCVEQAVRAAEKMVIRASMEERVEVSLEHLMLGVECGGSDTTSGIVSNPALGYVADKLVELGGTVIMSETTEWMGAENNLLRRAVSKEVGEKITKAVQWYEDYIQSIGVDLNGFNPAPDNIRALMEHFIEELRLPRHMGEIGVSEADFGQIARQFIEKSPEVSRLCHLTEEEVRNILYQAL